MHCAMTSFPSPQHPRYVQHSRRCVGMHGFKIGDTKIITCLKLGERKNVRLRAISGSNIFPPILFPEPHLPGRRYIHHFLPEGKINVFPFLQSGMLSKHEYAGTRLKHTARLDFRRFMIFPETPILRQNGIKKWHLVSTYGCFSAVFHLSSLQTDKKEAL